MRDRKCIDTLQALRCLAFLGVFLCHTGLPGMGSLGVGGGIYIPCVIRVCNDLQLLWRQQSYIYINWR